MSEQKPNINEVRAAWRRGIAEIPDASPSAVRRAITQIKVSSQKKVVRLTASDFALGTALCVTLSLLAIVPAQNYSNSLSASDLASYLAQDVVQEVISG